MWDTATSEEYMSKHDDKGKGAIPANDQPRLEAPPKKFRVPKGQELIVRPTSIIPALKVKAQIPVEGLIWKLRAPGPKDWQCKRLTPLSR